MQLDTKEEKKYKQNAVLCRKPAALGLGDPFVRAGPEKNKQTKNKNTQG